MWEVRVALGPDPVSGRTRVRSVTVHGDRETAQAARERGAASAELLRSAGRARPGITLSCLLREWLAADHGWRPSTEPGYRSAVGFLARDRIGSRRAIDVSPAVLAAAITAWRADGWNDPTVWARVRVLRSALGWAHVERILDRHPLEGMRGPPQAGVRLHAPVEQVRAILDHAHEQVAAAVTAAGADLLDRGVQPHPGLRWSPHALQRVPVQDPLDMSPSQRRAQRPDPRPHRGVGPAVRPPGRDRRGQHGRTDVDRPPGTDPVPGPGNRPPTGNRPLLTVATRDRRPATPATSRPG